MFTKSLAIALLLNEIKASTTADDTFANTITGCQAFAATFANTCSGAGGTGTASASTSAVTGES